MISTGTVPIGAHNVRRLLTSIIISEQRKLSTAGVLNADGLLTWRTSDDQLRAMQVAENDLGFDSLARLELVTQVTEFLNLDKTGVEDYLLVKRSIGEWIDLIDWHFTQVSDDLSFAFRTSGSTGQSKLVRHRCSSLLQEVNSIIDSVFAGQTIANNIVCAVPNHHIYGFIWGVLLPEKLNVVAVDVEPGLPSAVSRHVGVGDVVLATPYGWEKQALSGQSFPDGVCGISSGGPTTDKTWEAANSLGLSRLVEIYGSSETGGIGWRDSPKDSFRLFDHIVRHDEGLRRTDDCSRQLDIQDHLSFNANQTFDVLGRKDHVVQVAGVNVSLSEVERLMLRDTDAEDVAVRLESDRLKAFVAIGKKNSESAIRRQVVGCLAKRPAAERPQSITYGEQLPKSATGKRIDW